MTEIIRQIEKRIRAVDFSKNDFLDTLFGEKLKEVILGTPVILFGAGVMGGELCSTLKNNGISPLCFCDNDATRCGMSYRGIPIISFEKLKRSHKDSFVIIATKIFSQQLKNQLQENGFHSDQIICNDFDLAMSVFIRDGSQGNIEKLKKYGNSQQLLDVLYQNEKEVAEAYDLLADSKSKKLFIARLALMIGYQNFELLDQFMKIFSEPILQFGLVPWIKAASENFYYYTNDVLNLSNNEILVDVGAFDGDTVESFVRACEKNSLNFKHIYAFEPDPKNYQALVKNTEQYNNVSCHQLGLWSESGVFPFLTSDKDYLKSSSSISDAGDIDISVVSLDYFLDGKEVTFIKMDPEGNVIPEAIKGAAGTIAEYKPKLAVGAYHSFESIFEIPLLINSICPEYELYLRHHSWCINETDLLAFV